MMHAARRKGRGLLVCAVVCMVAGLIPLFGILAIQGANARHEAATAAAHETAVERWTPAEQRRALEKAEAYNRALYESGQP